MPSDKIPTNLKALSTLPWEDEGFIKNSLRNKEDLILKMVQELDPELNNISIANDASVQDIFLEECRDYIKELAI